jgi:hypothetical protein
MIDYPVYLDLLFIALVLALVLNAMAAIRGASPPGLRTWVRAGAAMGAWLVLTGVLAIGGYFRDFSTAPPRIALAIVPAFLAMLAIAFHPRAMRVALAAPHHWILYTQSFRILMEAILYLLYRNQAMPRVMTFEGRNFDLLTGLSALALAILWQRGWLRSKPVLRVWNWAGIAILALTFSQGFLSAPTPYQLIHEGVDNVVIGAFPFIWLPAFVVPYAFLLHILSLRKLRAERG